MLKKVLCILATSVLLLTAGAQVFAVEDIPVETTINENNIDEQESLRKLSEQYNNGTNLSIPKTFAVEEDSPYPAEGFEICTNGSVRIGDADSMKSNSLQLKKGVYSYDNITIWGNSKHMNQEMVVMIDDIPDGDIYKLSIVSEGQFAIAYGNKDVPAIVKLPEGSSGQTFEVYVQNFGSCNNSTPYNMLITHRKVSSVAESTLQTASFYHTTGYDKLYNYDLSWLPSSAVATSIIIQGTMKSPASYRNLRYNVQMATSYGKEVIIYDGLHTNKVTGLSNRWSLAFDPQGIYKNNCTFSGGSIMINYDYDVLNY